MPELSAKGSRCVQGCSKLQTQKASIHIGELIPSVCNGLKHSTEANAFREQQLEILTLRREAMAETLLQAYGEPPPENNLDSRWLLVHSALSRDTESTLPKCCPV